MQCDRGINYRYNGNHIIMYKCIKLTCCTTSMYTLLHVNCLFQLKNKHLKKAETAS